MIQSNDVSSLLKEEYNNNHIKFSNIDSKIGKEALNP